MRLPSIPLRVRHLAFLLTWLLCLAVTQVRAQTPIPSFPGAVGLGGTTTGACSLSGTMHTGGTVYHVTNLNDSGPGSFRTGVATGGNIIVFDVGGSIQLLSDVSATSNLTIEGQTAPGGIQIFGAEVSFYGRSNIICRYIHFRDGTLDPNYPGSSAVNSHTNAVSLGDTANVIMDHCSFEFAAYNNVDSVGAVNITFQNCIFADPIAEQRFNCHFETGPVTFIGNLWANAHGRSPLGKANLQFINNVVYNYGYAMDTGDSSGAFTWDVLNNLFIAGPSTTSAGDAYYQVDSNQSAYATGNYLDSARNGVLNASPDNTVNGATVLGSAWNATSASLATLSATAAYYNVVSNAGPVPRDPVDVQIIGNTLSLGTSGMFWTSQVSTGLGNSGYGVIISGTALPDSDASGMPDDWKSAMGLSLTDPSVGGVTSSTGYTNLENYLNWKAQPNAWVAKNSASQPTSVTIDLSQYANGFGAGATYTVSNPVKGAVTQSGTARYLVTFVPTSGTSGLGGFTWSVTNGITTMSSTCGVLISQSGPSQSVTWKGDGISNNWDLSTANWTSLSTGSATVFGAGDPVTFDDTGSVSPAVNVATAVSPGSITFDTYNNSFTLTGTGSLGGAGTLVKEGTASLTLKISGANTFSGGAILNSGTIYDYYSSSLGTGPISLNGGTLNLIATNSNYVTINNTTNVNVASTIGVQGSNIYLYGPFNGSAALTINFNGNIVCTPDASWSGFSGQLNLTGAGTFRIQNAGFPNSIFNCEGAEYVTNNLAGANTISFGALEGVSSTNLTGGGSAGSSAIYSIGALNTPSVFGGVISNSANQTVGLTETGNSTLTLSGDNTYTGPTSVTSGSLLLTGTLGNTNVTVSSGASFISQSLVTGTLTVNQGAAVYLGNSTTSNSVGTLKLGTGFVVAGGTGGASLYYGLSSSPTLSASNDQITVSAGTVNLSGTVNFAITLNNGVLGAGTYYLINGGASLSVPGGGNPYLGLNMGLPSGAVTRQTFTLARPASGSTAYITLTVTGNAGALTWTGSNGATWDLNTTSDWTGASPATFYDLDSVTFDDTDTNGTVALTGTLQPNVIYVTNNVTNYTFGGAGDIVGGTELIKSGTASLTISNTGANSFSGPIYLNAGTLYAHSYLGSGTIYLNGGVLSVDNGTYLGNPIVVGATSTIYSVNGSNWVANNPGATLSSTGPVTLYIGVSNGSAFTVEGNMDQFQGTFEMGASAGLVRLNGDGSAQATFDIGVSSATLDNRNGGITANFGAIEGGPNTNLGGRQAGSGDTQSTYLVGALNTNTTFAGSISNGGDLGGLNITKVGTGNWTLSGTSNFSGDITIAAGTLTISGSDNNGGLDFIAESGAALVLAGGVINTETVQILSGATFTGYGAIDAALVNQGATTINGPLTINGNFENDGTLTVTGSGSLVTNLPTDGSGSFVNNGLLDIMDSPTTSLPAGYVNNGTILTSALITVKQFSKSGATFSVSIQSYNGHTYQLQKSTDLKTWTNIGAAQTGTTGMTLTLSDTAASATGAIYQIAVGP
jgi:autotransporter-associated beta strand protein